MNFFKSMINIKSKEKTNFLYDAEYAQKFFTAWVATSLVDKEDPLKELNNGSLELMDKSKIFYSNLNHGIKSLAASDILDKSVFKDANENETTDTIYTRQKDNKPIDTISTRHIVCDCSIEGRNRIVVVVTVTNQSNFGSEFFKSIADSGALAESSMYKYIGFNSINMSVQWHGSKIPIRYLKEKWLSEDNFEIVFTGYGFGAALAAFLTLRLLTNEIDEEEKKPTAEDFNRVLFIGFGCPLFAGVELHQLINEKKLQERFHFYRHENDVAVAFRDVQVLVGISQFKYEEKRKKNDFDQTSIRVLGFRDVMTYHNLEAWNNSYSEYFNDGYDKADPMLTSKCTHNLNDLFEIFDYTGFYEPFGVNRIIFDDGTFETSEESKRRQFLSNKSIEIVKSSKQSNLIKNSINYITAEIINKQFKLAKSTDKQRVLEYQELKMPKFDEEKFVSNMDFWEYVKNKEDDEFFYTVFTIPKAFQNEIFVGVSYKSVSHLVYVSLIKDGKRIFFTRTRNDKNNAWFKLSQTKFAPKSLVDIELKSYFGYCRLDTIDIEKYKVKISEFNESESKGLNDKKTSIDQLSVDILYINAIIFLHTIESIIEENGISIKFKKRWNELSQIFEDMEELAKEQEYKPIEDKKKEQEYITSMFKRYSLNEPKDLNNFDWVKANEISFKKLIEDYSSKELMKQNKENISNDSENELLDKFKALLKKSIPKVYFLKRTEVEMVTKFKRFKFDISCYYAYYKTWMSNRFLSSLNDRVWYYSGLWYNKIDIEEDLKYEYGTMDLLQNINSKSEPLPILGDVEKKILDGLKPQNANAFELKEHEFMYKWVEKNHSIRSTLTDCFLIGVCGLKKNGKTKLVEFLTGISNKIADSLIETNSMSAYKLVDDVALIDYPHYNSGDKFYKVQFEYSKFFLNYVFVVVDCIHLSKSMTDDQINLFEELRGDGVCRFCIFINRVDQAWINLINKEDEDPKAMLDKEFKKWKSTIIRHLKKDDKETNYEDNLRMYLTCLDTSSVPGDRLIEMSEAGVLTGNKLYSEVLNILREENKNEKNDEFEKKLNELKELRKKQRKTKKCTFIHYKFNEKLNFEISTFINIYLKPNPNLDVGLTPYASDRNGLINLIKEQFSFQDVYFVLNKKNTRVDRFEEFFDYEDTVFEIKTR